MPASSQDLQTSFDPTSYLNITGAQLLQLVTGASPSSDKGMIVVTTDSGGAPSIPDATGTPKWQRYLWLRVSPDSTSITLYAWNPNQTYNLSYVSGGTTYTVSTNWNPVTVSAIPAGSIQGYQIANSTITKEKIQNIDLSQVNGSTALINSSYNFTGGDVTGSGSAGLFIGSNKVTSDKLSSDAAVDANRAVTTNSIKDSAVTTAKINNSAVTTDKIADTNVTRGKFATSTVPATNKVTPLGTDKVAIYDTASADADKYSTVDAIVLTSQYTVKRSNIALQNMPAAGALMTIAHGLSSAPRIVQVRLYLQTTSGTDANWSSGDELYDYWGINRTHLFAVYADGTNVYARRNSNSQINVLDKTTGAETTVTSTFQLRINCEL